jgi:predicted GIY-YIG superfamily endonuclease
MRDKGDMAMNKNFEAAVESLHAKYEALIGATPHAPGAKLPLKGVYLFSEKDKPFYVGRSDNVPKRFRAHRGTQMNQAALLRLMICRELGYTADYRKGRDKIKSLPGFDEASKRARNRISSMSFRAVEESDPTRQALLEIYCAVAAETPFNDFKNH